MARSRTTHRWLPGWSPARVALPAVAAAALLALAVPTGAGAAAAPPSAVPTTAGGSSPNAAADAAPARVLRVARPTPAQLQRLTAEYDLLEVRRGEDYFVLGDAATLARLRAERFAVSVERVLPALAGSTTAAKAGTSARERVTAPDGAAALAAYETFNGGYHTVAAHQQHLADVAAQYPQLATVVDYGDSWLRTRGRGGHDLLAVCITRKAAGDCARTPTAPKPRSVVYAAIHSRELATAEIAWNWIDHLVTSYGSDAAVTDLLNTTEVWVVPVANPDGRQIVESGGNRPYYQRKNANDSRGSCRRPPTTTSQFGVDLNRNATWQWGGVGSSGTACNLTYRGPSASSEPETTAQQSLFDSLFADRRGPARSDAAPADTTGTFMSYHSYGGLILYPWGDVSADAPNGAKLKALADRMAVHNGYTTGQGGEVLYATTGTTDDDLYGRLGVASFTTELGAEGTSCDGFMPPYSCVGSLFWPQERKVLMTLAQAAAGPYR